jgi:hypothetical protein
MKLTTKEKELLKWIAKGLDSYVDKYKDRASYIYQHNKKVEEARQLIDKLCNSK